MHTIDVKLYKQAWRQYEKSHMASDGLLYDMCAHRFARHDREDHVLAKVLIIALVYRADPGRHGKRMPDLAKRLVRKRSEVDHRFHALNALSSEDNFDSILKKVVETHKWIMDLFEGAAEEGRAVRSFASKYMHFHCPNAVPIFDRIANREIKLLMPRKRIDLEPPKKLDPHYFRFCDKFLALWADAERQGLEPTIRKIDKYLFAQSTKDERM